MKLSTGTSGSIQCRLCHHKCRLGSGQIGRCGVRQGDGSTVKSLVYGKLVAENVDPVEKKPLFHVLPGTLTYSIATPGCNFTCSHCQNSSISQVSGGLSGWLSKGRSIIERSPQEVVDRAISSRCDSVSYTYVEPTVFFEYAYDCAVLAKQRGLGNLYISNGYMSDEVFELLAPLITAINIDLKSWSDAFYAKVCGARVAPVIENIRKCVERGLWVEVTTLLIPGLNDSVDELQEIAMFLATLDRNIPWHVTAFHPAYKMATTAPTPQATIEVALKIGQEAGLNHVYSGNIASTDGASTTCPGCGERLISRNHFTLQNNLLKDGRCHCCNTAIAGVWR